MNIDSADKLGAYFNNTPALLEAAAKAVRETVLRHKLLGQPIVVWQEGKPVWIAADNIEVPAEAKQGTDTRVQDNGVQ